MFKEIKFFLKVVYQTYECEVYNLSSKFIQQTKFREIAIFYHLLLKKKNAINITHIEHITAYFQRNLYIQPLIISEREPSLFHPSYPKTQQVTSYRLFQKKKKETPPTPNPKIGAKTRS